MGMLNKCVNCNYGYLKWSMMNDGMCERPIKVWNCSMDNHLMYGEDCDKFEQRNLKLTVDYCSQCENNVENECGLIEKSESTGDWYAVGMILQFLNYYTGDSDCAYLKGNFRRIENEM